MREDSAEEISRPTTVLALVKAPLAATALEQEGEELLTWPVETLTLEVLAEAVAPFLVALEEVVMVVFPAVAGNLPLELSLALEEDMVPHPMEKRGQATTTSASPINKQEVTRFCTLHRK